MRSRALCRAVSFAQWDLGKLVDRFGADDAERIYGGLSEAIVVRLARGREFFYYKQGEIVDDEADRLDWLATTGFLCPRVVDRGNGWMLTTELRGRDVSDDWPAVERPAVLRAIATGLRELHALPSRSEERRVGKECRSRLSRYE